tara:strand:- start:3531 stop:3842 length:312 start_codon:yes stop_codon:yes gene_type:complete
MSDLAREVQKNYAKHLIEEAKKRANKTISDAYELLEKETKQQAETIDRLRVLLQELANDAEAEYEAKYDGMLNHPSMKRSYDRDMDVVNRAKSELNKLEAGEL